MSLFVIPPDLGDDADTKAQCDDRQSIAGIPAHQHGSTACRAVGMVKKGKAMKAWATFYCQ